MMSILQTLEPPPVVARPSDRASDRALLRVMLVADDRASAFASRRLIAADAGLIAVGEAAAADAVGRCADLEPDVVVLDGALSHDVALLVRELRTLDHPPGVILRTGRAEPLMMIAAVIAGAQGIVSRDEPAAVLCDAIRWVAGDARWLPEVPASAVSCAGSRVDRDDVPILLMLRRGMRSAEIAAELGISPGSLDVRRSAMVEACSAASPAGVRG